MGGISYGHSLSLFVFGASLLNRGVGGRTGVRCLTLFERVFLSGEFPGSASLALSLVISLGRRATQTLSADRRAGPEGAREGS